MRSARQAFIAARHARRAGLDASGSHSSEHPKPRRTRGFGLVFVAIREMRPERPNRA
jgi:hypothetical protein